MVYRLKSLMCFASLVTFLLPSAQAAKVATTGLNLLRSPGARSAALGDAFTAESNDVEAFSANPASLGTLTRGGASFMYEKGAIDDDYTHATVGYPLAGDRNQSIGLTVGYYKLGNFELFDGKTTRTVDAKRDLMVSAGYSTQLGVGTVGGTFKYISSELIETYSAQAVAFDLGWQQALNSHLSFGAAVQNIGTKMKYDDQSYNLPRMLRAGGKWSIGSSLPGVSVYLDSPYLIDQHSLQPGTGVESLIGPMALRVGYKKTDSVGDFSFGTGFRTGNLGLDYSYGLLSKDLDSRNQISLSYNFGGTK